MAFLKAAIVTLAVSAIWYIAEWKQFHELQFDRKCDDIVCFVYFLIIWYLFAAIG